LKKKISLLFFWVLLDLLDGFLNDTDSNGLLHVSDSESTKWWELVESFDNHHLRWGHFDDSGITRFDGFWEFFSDLTSSLVHLVFNFGEFASNMASMAIKNWRVTVHDLTWMVHDNNLSLEVVSVLGWLSLGIGGDETSLDIGGGKTLNVETNIVPRNSFGDLLMMHLDGFALGGSSDWTEGNGHIWLDDTGLDSTDWNCSNTRDLVDILEWESQWLQYRSLWWLKGIESLKEERSLVPFHVLGVLEHVISNPTGNWDERNLFDLVTNLLKIEGDLSFDLIVSLLLVVSTLGIHLVAAADHLLDTHGESKKSVLSGLSFL